MKDNPCLLLFSDESFVVKEKSTGITLAKGSDKHGLYALEENLHKVLTATKIEKNADTIWHQRLGHPHSRVLTLLKIR